MKPTACLLSALGLVLTVAPSLLVFSGRMNWLTHAHLMFAGMILWFATAPFWIRPDR